MDSKDLKKELEKMLEECGLNGEVIDLSNDNDKSEKNIKITKAQFGVAFCKTSEEEGIKLECGSCVPSEFFIEILGIEEAEFKKIYEPVMNAMIYCTSRLAKTINEKNSN